MDEAAFCLAPAGVMCARDESRDYGKGFSLFILVETCKVGGRVALHRQSLCGPPIRTRSLRKRRSHLDFARKPLLCAGPADLQRVRRAYGRSRAYTPEA